MISTLLSDINLSGVLTALELFSITHDLKSFAKNVKVTEYGAILQDDTFPITELSNFKNRIDLVLVHTSFEKRKSLIIKSSVLAATKLNKGGTLYLLGSKNEGIKSIAKQLSDLFSIPSETISFKKGIHLIKFVFPSGFQNENKDIEDLIETFEINGIKIKLTQEENVFAKGKLDSATRLLLENLKIKDNDKILDLGCGAGVLGIVASKMAKNVKVTFIDNDYLSVDTTQKNLILNQIQNSDVFVNNGAKAIKDQRFDVVVTNPPFHQGRGISLNITDQFIRDGSRILVKDGQMYVVCNVFLSYEKTMKRIFGNAKIIASNKSFKVILSTKE